MVVITVKHLDMHTGVAREPPWLPSQIGRAVYVCGPGR